MLKYYLITIYLMIGAMTSYAVAYIIHQQQITTTALKFNTASQNRYAAIKRIIDDSIATGNSLLGLFAASKIVEREEFQAFTHYVLKNKNHIKAIEWIPRVLENEKATYEAKARIIFPKFKFTQRNNNNQLVPVDSRDEYYPVYYMEPYEGNRMALGYDLASNPARKKALDYAINNNLPASTGRINLVQSRIHHWSFLIYFPIYNKIEPKDNIEWRRKNITGFIVTVFDIMPLLETSLSYLQTSGIDILVEDETALPNNRFLYYHSSRTRKNNNSALNDKNIKKTPEFIFTDMINLNNRVWRVTMKPAPGYFTTSISIEVISVFISGIIITITLFFYLFMYQQREQKLRKDKYFLEQKVLERTQKLNDKNSELETFSYSIAHDLRSPLRSITSFSQILHEEIHTKLNKEENSHINRIISASKYMAELIDDILELSRINNNKIKRRQLDLTLISNKVIEEICIEERNEHLVNWEIQPSVKGYGDPVLVKMLISNLLRNAYKFSYNESQAKIKFGLLDNKLNTYYISDNGIGFEMKYAKQIFGAFKRLHKRNEYEGTGIGLATVKRIVERHGGEVWTISEHNKGATFYFTLELQD